MKIKRITGSIILLVLSYILIVLPMVYFDKVPILEATGAFLILIGILLIVAGILHAIVLYFFND